MNSSKIFNSIPVPFPPRDDFYGPLYIPDELVNILFYLHTSFSLSLSFFLSFFFSFFFFSLFLFYLVLQSYKITLLLKQNNVPGFLSGSFFASRVFRWQHHCRSPQRDLRLGGLRTPKPGEPPFIEFTTRKLYVYLLLLCFKCIKHAGIKLPIQTLFFRTGKNGRRTFTTTSPKKIFQAMTCITSKIILFVRESN